MSCPLARKCIYIRHFLDMRRPAYERKVTYGERKDRNRRALAEWKNPTDRIIENTKKKYGSKLNLVVNRITENKLSDVITEFAQPLLDECVTYAQTKMTITLVILIWNSYLDPTRQDDQIIADIFGAIGGEYFQEDQFMKDLIAEYLQRRRVLYGYDRRLVVNYELSENKNETHLEVIHTTIPDLRENSESNARGN